MRLIPNNINNIIKVQNYKQINKTKIKNISKLFLSINNFLKSNFYFLLNIVTMDFFKVNVTTGEPVDFLSQHDESNHEILKKYQKKCIGPYKIFKATKKPL